ncbi:MAG: ribosomal RNA small subunit methyltransferase A [Gemmatimonadota bacterium]|nr:MAG: ribosomal RNA small subunit methyltransferase A [Gemmatimonadota bacterium]
MIHRGGHKAKKSLSQNFLIDPKLQRKIVWAIDPTPEDRVLEIGPGKGALTRHLASCVGHLTLVELDDKLAAELQEEYGCREDVVVIHGDALELSVAEIAGAEPLKVIGNIPYGITTPIIFHLLDQRPRPQLIVLTVQKEVARRLAARPGTKDYGALTVGVQAVARVELLFAISRAAFSPRPDVDSMVVRIVPESPAPLAAQQEDALRTLTRAAFQRRRKQFQKVLRQAPEYSLSSEAVAGVLQSVGIDPATRPDALPVADYIHLAAALSKAG